MTKSNSIKHDIMMAQNAVNNLPAKQRFVVQLHIMDNISFSDIGTLLNAGESTIRKAYRSALATLDKTFKAEQANSDLIYAREALDDIRKLTPELISYMQKELKSLEIIPPILLEELVAEFFASWGFDQVRVVGKEKWTGADVIAVKRGAGGAAQTRHFIEVKRWNRPVGIEVIEKVLGAIVLERPKHGWHVGMIVTTSKYSKFARYTHDQLSKFGLELKDGDDIRKWLGDYRPSPSGLWLPSSSSNLNSDDSIFDVY